METTAKTQGNAITKTKEDAMQSITVQPETEQKVATIEDLPESIANDFKFLLRYKEDINKEEGCREDLTVIYKQRGEDVTGLPQACHHKDPATPALLGAIFDDMMDIQDALGYQVRSLTRRFCLVAMKEGFDSSGIPMTIGETQSRVFDFLYGYAARAGEELGLTDDLRGTGRVVPDKD
ncbi:MAG: hypothetical protein HQ553_04475 [Chloroflexi bacterium]|nr:hypothetical protein [Chloroflexota bacterium]